MLFLDVNGILRWEDPGDGFDDLKDKLPGLIMASRSKATTYKYRGYFDRWKSFISERGHCHLPALGIHVAFFLVYLIHNGFSSSSIFSFVYAIKWVHKLNGFADPTLHCHVQSLLETSKRVALRPLKKKDHVSSESINQLFSKYKLDSDPLIVRDLCMIIISFCAFLRFNELSNIRCCDIVIHDHHFTINIRSSKTDQYRFGNIIVCSKLEAVACPYKTLCKYIDQNNIDLVCDDFLFKPMYRSGKVCRLIKKNKRLSYTRTK